MMSNATIHEPSAANYAASQNLYQTIHAHFGLVGDSADKCQDTIGGVANARPFTGE